MVLSTNERLRLHQCTVLTTAASDCFCFFAGLASIVLLLFNEMKVYVKIFSDKYLILLTEI